METTKLQKLQKNLLLLREQIVAKKREMMVLIVRYHKKKHRLKPCDKEMFANDINKLYAQKRDLAKKYRAHHIVYCKLRGRTIQQIEPHTWQVPQYQKLSEMVEQ